MAQNNALAPTWSDAEVGILVEDYLNMLADDLLNTPYNKSEHRRALEPRLSNRSKASINYKLANVSAALINSGFPYISGFKPLFNYQAILPDVVRKQIQANIRLQELVAKHVDQAPEAVPSPDPRHLLKACVDAPKNIERPAADMPHAGSVLGINYLEREARNRALGAAGEAFVISYEQTRLALAGYERLAASIEHTSRVRGDRAGYDIRSFETSGEERWIEVKTT